MSVVVPSYRHRAFIRQALQSVLDQTWPRLELILIDDASHDGTLQEAAAWATAVDAERRFERFILCANDSNLGAHGSINRGCSMSCGEYIAILNSDDLFHARRIESLLAAVREGGHLAFSRVVPIDEKGALVSPSALPPQLCGVFGAADFAVANLPTLSLAFRDSNIAISTGNFLFTRELFRQIGPFADLKYVHDWDFALRSTLIADPVYVPEDLYFYRIHTSNSFVSLANVAEVETQIVMGRFYAAQRHFGRAARTI